VNNKRAVKIYNKNTINQNGIDKIQNEISILEKLKHPNIIKLYEIYGNVSSAIPNIDYDDDKFMIVTELCTGGQLYDEMMRRG